MATQPGRDLPHHPVASVVAERVVDVAQPVDVDHEHGHDFARGSNLDRLFEQRQHPTPVRERGEGIVVCVEAQPIDQARVLHRDGSVRGKGLQQPYVRLTELRHLAQSPRYLERADHGRARAQGHHNGVLDAAAPDQRAQARLAHPRPDDQRRRLGHGPFAQHRRGLALGVTALGRQPERGVLGLQQFAHPHQQDVRQGAVAPGVVHGLGQLVQLRQAPVLNHELGVRAVDDNEQRHQADQEHDRPGLVLQHLQNDEADHDVDGGDGEHRG